MHDDRIVIIGAGQAGGTVAATLRQLGHGGAITLVGDEAWPPCERPPLSKGVLQGSTEVDKTFLRPSAFYAEQRIALLTSQRVLSIDRAARGGQLQLSGADPLAYDRLVIATGARARRLTVPGADHPQVHVLRSIDDSLRLRAALSPSSRLLIVGGGFIGLEIGASACSMGVAVTVIEQAPRLMGRVLPAAVSAHLAALHAAHGVEIHTGVTLQALRHLAGGVVAQTSAGPIAADVVAVGVGSIPNTELAADAGLKVDDGVVVDEFGHTSDPHIWAAGDVTRHFNPLLQRHLRLESWKNAQNQAIAVAKSLAGQAVPYAELPWLWTDQFDLNLQLAGLPQGGEALVWRGSPAEGRFTVFGLVDGVPRFAIAANQGRDMRFAQQLIQRAQAVDAERLADATTPLQRLVA